MKNNLMTHVVAGYPNMQECEEIVVMMSEFGIKFIEIQIPFSDPIADGPTIMRANEQALLNGTRTEDCFKLLERFKGRIKSNLLLMTYFNILFRYGLEKFCKKAKDCGIYGLIVPDMPIDEEKYEHYMFNCRKYGLHPIQIISPLTTEKRLKRISKFASGFVYCVSTFGVTGERSSLDPALFAYFKKVKKYIKLPLALGFGISNREQVLNASKYADIVVIGSKIINLLKTNSEKKITAIENFLREIV